MAKELTKSEMRRLSIQNPMTLVEVVTKTREERDQARSWALRWKKVAKNLYATLKEIRAPEYVEEAIASGMRTLFKNACLTVDLKNARDTIDRLTESLAKEVFLEKDLPREEREIRGMVLTKVRKSMNWNGRKALLWYYTANPLLGGILPSDMVGNGGSEKLMKWIDTQEKGQLQ